MEAIEIRAAQPGDADALLALRHALDAETDLMLLEVGERTQDPVVHRQQLSAFLALPNAAIWLARDREQLVGFLQARGGPFRRNAHVADIVIGLLQSHVGRGIGKRLFAAVEAWAPSAGVQRLELTVMAHNERARRLYRAAGFVEEGRKHASLRVDATLVDEIVMARVLR